LDFWFENKPSGSPGTLIETPCLFQWATCLHNLTTLIIFRAPEVTREIAESVIESLPNLRIFGDFHSFDLKRPQEMRRLQVGRRLKYFHLQLWTHHNPKTTCINEPKN
jgi:hypothetical protein